MLRDGGEHSGVDSAGTAGSPPQKFPAHGAREVIRFGATERFFHWAFAIPLLGLLLSGLPLSFPVLRSWINGYSTEIGLRLHLVCSAAWVLSPVLVLMLGDRGALARVSSDLFVIVRQERSWLRQLPRWLAGLPCEMRGVGRFNAGQKLNALFVAMTSALFLVTGVILWVAWQWPGSAAGGQPIVGTVVGWSRRFHYLFTVIMLPPLLGHIALATVHPRTKESLRGMLFGTVDAEWARRHHPVWYGEMCQQPSDFAAHMEANRQSIHVPTTPRKSECPESEIRVRISPLP